MVPAYLLIRFVASAMAATNLYTVCVARTASHAHCVQVRICHHSTGNEHINKYTATIPVILARHWLLLPDWFLRELKHIGADFIILMCFSYNVYIKCISWIIQYLGHDEVHRRFSRNIRKNLKIFEGASLCALTYKMLAREGEQI